MLKRLFARIWGWRLTRLTLGILKWCLIATLTVLESTLSFIFPTAPYSSMGVMKMQEMSREAEKMREVSDRERMGKW